MKSRSDSTPHRPALLRHLGATTAAAALVPLAWIAGCSGESEPKPAPPSPTTEAPKPAPEPAKPTPPAPPTAEEPTAPADPAALAKRGQAVYNANCIACHNPDPSVDGALGPAIAGSSYALLEARVMRAEYPEGYTPKRDTKLMIALPYLEPDLPALEAFLAP